LHPTVETELSCPQIEHNRELGAPALQQHVRSPQAPSGRSALHTTHTGATQPGGSTLQQRPPSPAPSGRRAESALPTQPCTTTVFSPEQKLANSPIIVANLGKKLEDYAKINRAHATDLWNGFSYGFKLGYMGPRELKMSKILILAKENSSEVHSKINAEIKKGRVGGP